MGKPRFELPGKTLGIVGLGRIGRSLVRKARGLELQLIAYDPYLSDDIFELLGVRRCYDLEDLLAEADIVSLHVTLTPETHHVLDDRNLGRMKRSAILVNTCRGKVVEEVALLDDLKRKTIAGGAGRAGEGTAGAGQYPAELREPLRDPPCRLVLRAEPGATKDPRHG